MSSDRIQVQPNLEIQSDPIAKKEDSSSQEDPLESQADEEERPKKGSGDKVSDKITIPDWAKNTGSIGGIGAAFLFCFSYVLENQVRPLATEAKEARTTLTKQMAETNSRLQNIEKSTFVLSNVGKAEKEQMQRDIFELQAEIKAHVNDPSIHQSRFAEIEKKLVRMEILLEKK